MNKNYIKTNRKCNKIRLDHYTSFKSAKSILNSMVFRFSSSSMQNDLMEPKLKDPLNRGDIFTSSFACCRLESVPMWAMYGKNKNFDRIEDQGVRISFVLKGDAAKLFIDEKQIFHFDKITYVPKRTTTNNMQRMINENSKLFGFLKNAYWEHEHEYRYIVFVKNETEKNKLAHIDTKEIDRIVLRINPSSDFSISDFKKCLSDIERKNHIKINVQDSSLKNKVKL